MNEKLNDKQFNDKHIMGTENTPIHLECKNCVIYGGQNMYDWPVINHLIRKQHEAGTD